jgi:hypothetical protein
MLVLTVLVTLLEVSGNGAANGAFSSGSGNAASHSFLGASEGAGLLSSAERSLTQGQGPADGMSAACTEQGSLEASCGTADRTALDPGASRATVPLPSWSAPGPPVPTSRKFASATWDPSLGADLFFGGCKVYVYYCLNDSWTYVGGAWTNLSLNVAPSPRGLAAMAYDAYDHEVVLFGGFTLSGTQTLGDTWTFANGGWTNLTSTLKSAPSARYGASLAYDNASTAQYLLLFGGSRSFACSADAAAPCDLESDTWEFRGNAWTNVTATVGSPTARAIASMTYDAYDNEIVLFGGTGARGYLTDTWTYQSYWREDIAFCNLGITSPCLHDSSMVYDSVLGEVILAGGLNDTISSAENTTWAFRLGTWTPLFPGLGPVPLSGPALAYDVKDGVVVFEGGSDQEGLGGYFVDDTWTFSATGWTPVVRPPDRFEAMIAYDAADGYVVLFGGWMDVGRGYGDTWEYDGAGNWTLLHTGKSPPARYDAVMAYDAADREVILYGGAAISYSSVTLTDTWAFRAGLWTNLTASLTTAPGPLAGASMAYDAADGYLVLFGGQGACALTCHATWTFVGNKWTELNPSMSPPGREEASLAYDVSDSELVLFGGLNYSETGTFDNPLSDTWTFAGGTWTYRNPSVSPSARQDAMMATDVAGGGVLLFGGDDIYAIAGENYFNDTWQFVDNTWTNLTSSLPSSPPRWWYGAATNDSSDGMLIFGGVSAAGDQGGSVATTLLLTYPQAVLTMRATPVGAGTVTPSTGAFVIGSTETIAATAASGYHFVAWAGSGATGNYSGSANPASVTVNGEITETATFAVTIALTAVGISPPSARVAAGQSEVFNATATCSGGPCPVTVAFAWSTNNSLGSISGSGSSIRFTAGGTAGVTALNVSATLSGVTEVGSAQITTTVASPSGSPPPTSGNGGSFNHDDELYLGLGAAIAAVGAVAYVVVHRRRSKTAPPPPSVGGPPP